MGAETGAIPIEEFARVESEVHHLDRDFREHKADTRERFGSIDTRLGALGKDMVNVAQELHGLNKTVRLVGLTVGPILLTILTAVLTKVFSH